MKKILVIVLLLALITCVFAGCVELGLAPTHDSDGDGWNDEQEKIAGTDPYEKDTDGDGYWDSHDSNPLDANIPVSKITATPMPTPTPTPAPTPTPTTVLKAPIYTLFAHAHHDEWFTLTLYPNGNAIVVEGENPDEPYIYSWKLYRENVYYILENDELIVQISLFSDNTCLMEEMQIILPKGDILATSGIWSHSPIPTPSPIPT